MEYQLVSGKWHSRIEVQIYIAFLTKFAFKDSKIEVEVFQNRVIHNRKFNKGICNLFSFSVTPSKTLGDIWLSFSKVYFFCENLIKPFERIAQFGKIRPIIKSPSVAPRLTAAVEQSAAQKLPPPYCCRGGPILVPHPERC